MIFHKPSSGEPPEGPHSTYTKHLQNCCLLLCASNASSCLGSLALWCLLAGNRGKAKSQALIFSSRLGAPRANRKKCCLLGSCFGLLPCQAPASVKVMKEMMPIERRALG